jgi:hypothetical protein
MRLKKPPFPIALAAAGLAAAGLACLHGCRHLVNDLGGYSDPIPPNAPAPVAPTFSVSAAELPSPMTFIVYGDMRFTSVSEIEASRPAARRALVERVTAEQPGALFLTGDVPWHGIGEDYAVYREETRAWRRDHLRVYPALGNHEFSNCSEAECLGRWWTAFPQVRGHRWYSVALGTSVLALVLDSDADLVSGSEQRIWLEDQLTGVDARVRVVLIVLHHPPVADPIVTASSNDHRVRPNEAALEEYLAPIAGHLRARMVVVGGHVHNYERFERGGIVYLVSGGGGAKPYQVQRSAADLYQDPSFPNFHYVRFELRGASLIGEMVRLDMHEDGTAGEFKARDHFEISLPP